MGILFSSTVNWKKLFVSNKEIRKAHKEKIRKQGGAYYAYTKTRKRSK